MNLTEFLNSEYFEVFQQSVLNHLVIENIDRYNRVVAYAKTGCNGSTRNEEFQDVLDAIDCAFRDSVISLRVARKLIAEVENNMASAVSNGIDLNAIIG